MISFPLHLGDFFKPLTPILFLETLLIWFGWDIVGFTLSKLFIKSPKFTRILLWQLGMGLYIFIWFLTNLFLPLQQKYVVFVYLAPLLLCIPHYLKHKGWISLLRTLRQYWLPFLIFLPMFPLLWIKASLPPYQFDEMAYHFLSPLSLATTTIWKFSGGIYQAIPQSLDTLFHSFFAFFLTYSPARLTHFAIAFTIFLCIYSWTKKYFNKLSALIVWLFFLYLPGQSLLYAATSGYVDIASSCFIVMGVLLTIYIYQTQKLNFLPFTAAFWGLALGTKYTSIQALAAFGTVLGPMIIWQHKNNLNKFIKPLLISLVTFTIFGGFWYVKNIYFTHNPIYPFLFGCKPADCVGNASFFGDWTTKITWHTLPSILSDLVVGNKKVALFFITAILLSPFTKSKKLRKINLVLVCSVILEFIIMKYFSGFYLRYFLYLRFLIVLFIGLQVYTYRYDYHWVKVAKFCLIISLIWFWGRNLPRELKNLYGPQYVSNQETQFALGKINIYQWVDKDMPTTDVVRWCEQLPVNRPITLYETDPDLIWFEYAGMMRIFMTNCNLQVFDIPSDINVHDTYKYLQQIAGDKDTFFVSNQECSPSGIMKNLGYENPQQKRLRLMNNDLICHLERLSPHIYSYRK